MLISLHLPKTAGTSFYKALAEHFGSRILRDYADFPYNTPPIKRNGGAALNSIRNIFLDLDNFDCIHGHFLPLKYWLYGKRKRETKFVTWLRDPVERLASNYFHWLRSYSPSITYPLQKKVVEEKWSLERFCLSTEFQNFYTKFLWGFPLTRFDFVGIVEYYGSELEYFSRKNLGSDLNSYYVNDNSQRVSKSYFMEDSALRKKIELFHEKDMKLYKSALEIRAKERT